MEKLEKKREKRNLGSRTSSPPPFKPTQTVSNNNFTTPSSKVCVRENSLSLLETETEMEDIISPIKCSKGEENCSPMREAINHKKEHTSPLPCAPTIKWDLFYFCWISPLNPWKTRWGWKPSWHLAAELWSLGSQITDQGIKHRGRHIWGVLLPPCTVRGFTENQEGSAN